MAELPSSATQPPKTDPTLIFKHFRGSYGTELLTVAVAHFDLFGQLASGSKGFDELRQDMQLESRPAHVLITALRAMQLIRRTADDRIELTPVAAEHLTPGTSSEARR